MSDSSAFDRPVPPVHSGPSAQLASNPDTGRHDQERSSAAQAAADQGEKLKDKTSDLAQQAQQQASRIFDSAKDKTREIAEEQKSAGADTIAGVARAIDGAADNQESEMPGAAKIAREAASGIDRFSSSLRNRSVGEMMDAFNNFARTQPVAFFGATVLAGFAVSRFLKSSAEDRPAHTGSPTRERPSASHPSRVPGADSGAHPQHTAYFDAAERRNMP
jgi:hypothetical protein